MPKKFSYEAELEKKSLSKITKIFSTEKETLDSIKLVSLESVLLSLTYTTDSRVCIDLLAPNNNPRFIDLEGYPPYITPSFIHYKKGYDFSDGDWYWIYNPSGIAKFSEVILSRLGLPTNR